MTNKLIDQDTHDIIQGSNGYIYVSDGSVGRRVVKLFKESTRLYLNQRP